MQIHKIYLKKIEIFLLLFFFQTGLFVFNSTRPFLVFMKRAGLKDIKSKSKLWEKQRSFKELGLLHTLTPVPVVPTTVSTFPRKKKCWESGPVSLSFLFFFFFSPLFSEQNWASFSSNKILNPWRKTLRVGYGWASLALTK